MTLERALILVYESFSKDLITKEECDFLVEEVYNACINSFILESELEYLDEIADMPILESADEDIDIEDYTYAKTKIYEAAEEGEITETFAEFVLELITEAEKDHYWHMKQKKIAARRMGVKAKDLPNKKYATNPDGTLKDPEKARKADLKYKYKDKFNKQSKTSQSSVVGRYTANTWNHDNIVANAGDSRSTIKMLEYLQKKGQAGDEESIRKYKQVFSMFCRKYGLDEESSLYVAYNPRKVFHGKLGVSEWKQGQSRNADTNHSDTGHALPSGYWLLHQSPADDIKELNPTRVSNHFVKKGKSGVNGQYRKEGRVYFTLQKGKGELSDMKNSYHNVVSAITGKMGKHIYKLDEPIKEFFIDSENPSSRQLDKAPIEKLVGKAVYVKTDKPLKVRKLK